MPPVTHAYKLISFFEPAAVAIATVSRYAAGNRDSVDPVYAVVMHDRTGTSYGFDSAITPVDSSVHRTAQCQSDRRPGPKARVPRRYKVRAVSPERRRRCPTKGTGIEVGRLRRELWNAPSGQIMVERRGAVEHRVHVGDLGGIPTADCLVERRRTVEHRAHVGHAGGIPAADILVKRQRKAEHMPHIGHTGGIPAAYILVKHQCIAEHIAHVGHAGGIPTADVTVKRRRTVEHIAHVDHAGDIPAADVIVKCRRTVEHIPHVGHSCNTVRNNRY